MPDGSEAFVGDIAEVDLHQAGTTPDQVQRIDGVAISVPARTVVDIGREHGVRSSLVTADAALHTGACDEEALKKAVQFCRGWPGVRASREAVDFADPLAESPLESLSRFDLRGLVPAPKLQTSIHDSTGRFLARVDFDWTKYGVVGEADGMTKYDAHTALRLEKVRQEELEQVGLVMVRWGREDLKEINWLASRILNSFQRASSLGRSGRWISRPA